MSRVFSRVSLHPNSRRSSRRSANATLEFLTGMAVSSPSRTNGSFRTRQLTYRVLVHHVFPGNRHGHGGALELGENLGSREIVLNHQVISGILCRIVYHQDYRVEFPYPRQNV